MTKTFKTCAIFSITSVWLLLGRIVFGEINLGDNLSDWLFSFFVQVIGMGVIPLVLYKLWVKGLIVEGFSLRISVHPLVFLAAIGMGICLHFLIRSVSAIWQTIAILMGYVPTNSAGTIFSSPEVFVFSFICTACLPAIFEELTYRGLGMTMLSEIRDEKKVILLIGLLFGLGHQFILQTGYAFIAGIIFGFFAVKTRSILPGMIIHFINNALSVIGDYSQQKQNSFYALENMINNVLFRSYATIFCTLIASAAAVIGLCVAVQKLTKTRRPESSENEGTYYCPTGAQYVDNIFGRSFVGSANPVFEQKQYTAWYEYAFLYASIALMTATTVFTFVWGVMR